MKPAHEEDTEISTRAMQVVPRFPEARPEGGDERPPRTRYWLFGILAVALLCGGVGIYILNPGADGGLMTREPEVSPSVRPYLERARQGDAEAMQMLGTMYYNGLNVRQDRKEGIRWFRRAAKAGSVAARRDLEQLGLPVEGK
ncbi:MAG TPA: hypothetical protein VK188_16625 [Holophaga sp.]|nr:hypothetical protein [Holophaga sp.]